MIITDMNDNLHELNSSLKSKGQVAFWDGWDIVVHTYSLRAWRKPDGVFYKGECGFQKRISPNTKTGNWNI